jgi:hypothetical protein
MWYYVHAGETQTQGPFDERAFDDLITQGTITPDSLVWNQSLASWTPLRQVRPVGGSTVATAVTAADSTCAICHANVGTDNLIELAGVRVCAACKPLAVQKLREGLDLTASGTAWRDGKKLVTHDQARLPQRCVKCNSETTEPPLKRKFQYHHPAYYLFIFVGVLIYIIIAICVRKSATVELFLCTQHRQRRRNFIIGGWGGAGVAILLFLVGAALNYPWITISGVVLFFVAAIAGIAGAQIVRTVQIKGKTVWLGKAGPDFLASLPEWKG